MCIRDSLDAEGKEECYDVGFIFCKKISQEKGLREQEYINLLLEKIQKSTVHPVVMYVGSEVEDISDISESFRSAVIAKTFSNFKVMPNLLYYSKEQKNPSGIVVSHKKIEDLLRSVEENDKKRIEDNVAAIYEEMNEAGMNPELVQMNMNYLLYRLVSLAMEQDDSVNQDEVLQYICENAFQVHMIRGTVSYTHLLCSRHDIALNRHDIHMMRVCKLIVVKSQTFMQDMWLHVRINL